ncbi:hypothetical protein FOL47_000430 [Perkinsus chesapeaki]|uniref:subtilisin n=1 Tax=Perkinsus chesapeaki TaxID=330153 RepID=A0A7J6MLV0_PERCH|nr:hypothetical protein FOL47_000430 [Perkinsus chesapeaki]
MNGLNLRSRLFFLVYPFSTIVAIRQARGVGVGIENGPPVNDPFYDDQEPYFNFVGIPSAWRRMASVPSRKRVTVASLDTGVKPDHPDLVGSLVKGYNVIDKTTNTPDKHGHGTSMAGIFGATTNNSIGIAGVTNLVNIMPISMEDQWTDGVYANAVEYAINKKDASNIKVIHLPFSGTEPLPQLAEKIEQAIAAGMLVIVTAGNNATNITEDKRYPCALTERLRGMLCVAATERTEMKLEGFSNFGDCVDIAAPGDKIFTTYNNDVMHYGVAYKTSAASAIVVGVAAMLYSLNPNLSPVEVKQIIKSTSRKGIQLTPRVTLPFGLIDAGAAVEKVLSR